MRTAVFIFAAAAVILSHPSSAEDSCQTPNSKKGDCISIRRCPVLLKSLSQKPVKPETAQFLRESGCGFEGKTPKVCCPVDEEDDLNEDYDSHPNRKLFPQFPDCGLSVFNERVVGGEDAKVGAFPWMALLGYQNKKGVNRFMCGGAIISEYYILTAAHCIHVGNYELYKVRLGEHDIRNEGPDCAKDTNHCAPPAQDYYVESTRIHSAYDTPKFKHDIALIRVKNKIAFNNFVRPICLPFPMATSNFANLNPSMEALFVAGWGKTESGRGSNILQQLRVPLVTLRDCKGVFKTQIQLGESQMCAGGERGKDSCSGDSGGPLMLLKGSPKGSEFFVAAVVSVGPTACGTGGQPGIYTRIGAYIGWILDNVRN